MCCGSSKYAVEISSEDIIKELVELIRRGPETRIDTAVSTAMSKSASATSTDAAASSETDTTRSLELSRDEKIYVAEFTALLKQHPKAVNWTFKLKSTAGTSVLPSTLLLKACEYGRAGLVQAIVNVPGFDAGIVCCGEDSQGPLALQETIARLTDPRTSTTSRHTDLGIHFERGLRIIDTLVTEAHINPRTTVKTPGPGFVLIDTDAYAAIPDGLSEFQCKQINKILNAYKPRAETTSYCTTFWQMMCCCCCSTPEATATA
jgi:hypothetical protein